MEREYNELKILSCKQSLEEFLFQRFVKTTFQKPYDKAFFDNVPNAKRILSFFVCCKT